MEVQIHRIGTLGKSLGRASRATFELPGFSAMSASRFLRTTTRRSDEDVMETTPEARSTSDHPSRVEFIVKMAPQSPCSDNHEDKRIPSCRQKKLGYNWADATCTPWSRPSRAPSPRPSSSTPTPSTPRSSTTTRRARSSTTPWTLSPRSREAQGWPPSVVLFLLCTERAATRSRNRKQTAHA